MSLEVLTWVDRLGVSHVWPYGKLQQIQGLGMPPIVHSSESSLNIAGATFLGTKKGKRRISIPLVLDGDATTTRTLLRSWVNWLDTTLAEGYLQVTSLLGDTRQIKASYVGGLELVQDYEHVLEARVELDCFDPFFTSTTATTIPVSTVTAVTGDVPASPLWGLTRVDHGFIDHQATLTGPLVPVLGPEAGFWNYRMRYDGTLATASTWRTMVADARHGKRSLWVSSTYYADPIGQYLTGVGFVPAESFTRAGNQWFHLPFDRYYTGVNAAGAGTALLTPSIKAPGVLSDYSFQVEYFPRWLTA